MLAQLYLKKGKKEECAMSGSVEDFLHMFNEEQTSTEETSPQKEKKETGLDKYKLRETEFKDQLRVWRNDISKENPNNKDLLTFLKSSKQERVDLIKKEVEKYGSIKVTFGDLANFQRKRNGVIQKKRHWFHEKEPHIFTKANMDEIGEEYDKYVEWVMGQVNAWNSKD